MLPQVLEKVAPTMRLLGGASLCIHARVEDEDAGFLERGNGARDIANGGTEHETLQTKKAINSLMLKWKTIFDCAEVCAMNCVSSLMYGVNLHGRFLVSLRCMDIHVIFLANLSIASKFVPVLRALKVAATVLC